MSIIGAYLLIKAYSELLGISMKRALDVIEDYLGEEDICEIVTELKELLINNRSMPRSRNDFS